jgi:hypothetical protein
VKEASSRPEARIVYLHNISDRRYVAISPQGSHQDFVLVRWLDDGFQVIDLTERRADELAEEYGVSFDEKLKGPVDRQRKFIEAAAMDRAINILSTCVLQN